MCLGTSSAIRSFRKSLTTRNNLWAVILFTVFHCNWEDRKNGTNEKNLWYQKIRTLHWDEKKKDIQRFMIRKQPAFNVPLQEKKIHDCKIWEMNTIILVEGKGDNTCEAGRN